MRGLVALSGGVDSSVAAALLAAEGHELTAVTMRLAPPWLPDAHRATESAIESARTVADHLGIVHEVVDFSARFQELVIQAFAAEYAAGRTPNPCVVCNQTVKFGLLAEYAAAHGADFLATGHYVDVRRDTPAAPGSALLVRDLDNRKDQTYFMYRVAPETLARCRFPLAGTTKEHTRALAADFGLPTAERAESQDVCFLAGDPAAATRAVFERLAPHALTPGPIVSEMGALLGRHRGLATLTVGQRGGLGVGGLPEPLYVGELRAERNEVVLVERARLAVTRVVVGQVVWHTNAEPGRCLVALRYNQRPVGATARWLAARADDPSDAAAGERQLELTLDEPAFGVAPGQSAVCYSEVHPDGAPSAVPLIGGGIIACAN